MPAPDTSPINPGTTIKPRNSKEPAAPRESIITERTSRTTDQIGEQDPKTNLAPPALTVMHPPTPITAQSHDNQLHINTNRPQHQDERQGCPEITMKPFHFSGLRQIPAVARPSNRATVRCVSAQSHDSRIPAGINPPPLTTRQPCANQVAQSTVTGLLQSLSRITKSPWESPTTQCADTNHHQPAGCHIHQQCDLQSHSTQIPTGINPPL